MSQKTTTSKGRQRLPANDNKSQKDRDTFAGDISKKEFDRTEYRFMRKRSSSSLPIGHSSCSCKCVVEPPTNYENPRLEKVTLDQRASDRGESTRNLSDFLSNVFMPEKKTRKSSLSSCTSSSSEDSSSSSEESDIVPVKACTVESLPSPRILRHGTTQEQVNPANPEIVSENDYIGLSGNPLVLHHWDLKNNTYVFAFQDASKNYLYIKTPTVSGEHLILTKSGGDPSAITDPTSDQRCMKYLWNGARAGYLLHPAHNEDLAIAMKGGHAIVTSTGLADKWNLI